MVLDNNNISKTQTQIQCVNKLIQSMSRTSKQQAKGLKGEREGERGGREGGREREERNIYSALSQQPKENPLG